MTSYVVKQESMSSPTPTIHIENGEQVYPCRCGQTHRGDYALYDWAHHNCFHREPLILIAEDIPGYYMCPSCGEVFWTKAEYDALQASYQEKKPDGDR